MHTLHAGGINTILDTYVFVCSVIVINQEMILTKQHKMTKQAQLSQPTPGAALVHYSLLTQTDRHYALGESYHVDRGVSAMDRHTTSLVQSGLPTWHMYTQAGTARAAQDVKYACTATTYTFQHVILP